MVIQQVLGKKFAAYHGDCMDVMREMPENSIDEGVCSPPFADLYVYSASDHDLGNVKNEEVFFEGFVHHLSEMYRILRPGRLFSFHCMNLPSTKERHGYIGIRDFRGDLIRACQAAGFIYHSEVCIWKDPVTAMQRTKAIGLLHKQIVKDSAMSRQGIPDYLVTMRKPGTNEKPVAGPFWQYHGEDGPARADAFDEYLSRDPDGNLYADIEKWFALPEAKREEARTNRYSIEVWQRYASPVWFDINPSDTLQFRSAREEGDLRHICALQLGVIRRCLDLWSLPGDVVFDPYGGIGSTAVVALEMGRKAVTCELKETYFNQLARNCANAEGMPQQMDLF